MKKLLISSVVEFKLKDKLIDELALELFNIERNKGSRFKSENKIENLEQSNDYLNYQFERLVRYCRDGQFEKFDYLASRLLKSSDVYLVYATNHVYERWHLFNLTKIMQIISEVRYFAKNDWNQFRYKRVWIPKGDDQAGRPLGVPYPSDRIYCHMITRIMEAYLIGCGKITNNQHGGISGRGVMTFLKALVKRFRLSERIFEFDIKGYFDHINHSSVMNLFPNSRVIRHYLEGALKSTPMIFTQHQPLEDDPAVKILDDKLNTLKYYGVKPEISLELSEINKKLGISDARQLELDLMDLASFGDTTVFDFEQFDFMMWKGADAKALTRPMDFSEYYKPLRDSGTHNPQRSVGITVPINEINADELMAGKEKWKDLDLPNQGVPQGSSFGPLVASIILGQVMPSESLLYMDDGIIFMGSSRSRKTTMVNRMNKRLESIGCTLQETKCGVLTTTRLWKQGLKIVGLRLKRTLFTYASGVDVFSETRKGVSRPFFGFSEENMSSMILELFRRGYIKVSKKRLLMWYLKKGKLDVITKTPLIELADKLGILGTIMSRAYSPETSMEEMKSEIEAGILKATLKAKSSTGSIGERIINMSKAILLECTEGQVNVKTSIYNTRPIANQILLRYLKGELPIKALRVQGMRKPWKGPALQPVKKSKVTKSSVGGL